MKRTSVWMLLAALTVATPVASAQEGGDAPDRDYEGVVPGETDTPPPGVRLKGGKHPALFWIGFQPRDDGSSRVFVQLGREVDYEQRMDGSTLVVSLRGARFANGNARRPVITRFFDSAVATIDARRTRNRRARKNRPATRAGVELRITFRNPADATQASASMSKEADGFTYLFLDFGPGSGAPEPTAASVRDDGDEPDPDGRD